MRKSSTASASSATESSTTRSGACAAAAPASSPTRWKRFSTSRAGSSRSTRTITSCRRRRFADGPRRQRCFELPVTRYPLPGRYALAKLMSSATQSWQRQRATSYEDSLRRRHLYVIERDHWQYVERKKGKEPRRAGGDGRRRDHSHEQFRRPLNARVIDFPRASSATRSRTRTARRLRARSSKRRLVHLRLGRAALPRTELAGHHLGDRESLPGPWCPADREGGGVRGEDITVHVVTRPRLRAFLREKSEAAC